MDKIHAQSGNVFFVILLGITMFAALTGALVQMDRGTSNVSNERVEVAASQALRYISQLKQSVDFLYQDGVSEANIRFSHPKADSQYGDIATNTNYQVFSENGGGLAYTQPPKDISASDIDYDFFGFSAAPQVGTSAPDLMVVMRNVNESVCNRLNEMVGYDKGATIPSDTGTCVYSSTTSDKFTGTFTTGGSINDMGETDYNLPAYQACVACGSDYHFYSVLIER